MAVQNSQLFYPFAICYELFVQVGGVHLRGAPLHAT